MLDQKKTVNAIEFGTELGAHVNWDRNLKAAKRDGLEPCAHCAKGMEQGTGYLVRVIVEREKVINFDATQGEIVRIGSTCINKFAAVGKLPATHFAKAGN